MAGVVIDPETGHPRVVCVRTNDGVLRFAYEVRHQGGMAKLLDVPPEAMAGRRVDQSEESDLQASLRDAAIALASQLGVAEPRDPIAEEESAEALRLRAETAERERTELEQAAARAEAERNAAVEALDAAEEEQSAGEVELATLREQVRQAEEARAEAVAESKRLAAEAKKKSAGPRKATPARAAA